MARELPFYYSVYDRRTDQPIVIHARAEECAKALGIRRKTFYSYIARARRGKVGAPKKYEIYIDENEEDDEDEMDLH